MRFSESKTKQLLPQKSRALSTFLLGLLTAALFFVPYVITDGGYFTFFGEFNSRQIPVFQMCHDAVKSGEFGWNNLTGLGTNFIGSYAFYALGSPFFWITLPFTNSFVPYLLAPLFVIKFGCAALTGYLYLRRFTRTGEAARIGGLLYAFSSFAVCGIYFNNFHEAVIMFPLLLLTLELLITETRRGIFALAVTLCAVINYFFFFSMAVFCIIYILVRVLSRAIKLRFARVTILLLEAVLGIGMAAFLVFPSLLALLSAGGFEVPLGWSGVTYGNAQGYLKIIHGFFFPPEIPSKEVFLPEGRTSLGGWLPLFGMVGVFTFFFTKRKHWIKRLLGVCLFAAFVPVINNAFFAYNTTYYAQWFYMPILIMCLASVIMIEDVGAEWNMGWKWVFGITVGFALTIGLFPNPDADGNIVLGLYSKGNKNNLYTSRFWVAVAVAVVGLIVLRLLLILLKSDRAAFMKSATACICVIAVIYANVFVATGRIYSKADRVIAKRSFDTRLELPQEDNYRIDVYGGMENTAMYLRLPSITGAQEFYSAIGAPEPIEDDVALRSLLSVRYIINHADSKGFVDTKTGETALSGFEYLSTSEDYYIYENKNYIPYGFSYKYYMTEEFFESIDASKRSAMLLKAMLLTKSQIEEYGDELINIESTDMYSYDSEVSLFNDYETLVQDSLRLKQTAADTFDFTDSGFNATVTRNTRSLVFFSVPFDEGWSATVDGVAAKIEKVNAGFMAVEVEAGVSEIVFDYETPGLKKGIIISLGTIAVFLFYMLLVLIYYRNREDTTHYPEGNELIYNWHKEDMFISATNIEEEHHSILDDSVQIPHIDNGFVGGFTINTSFVDEKPPEEKTE